MVTAHSLIYDRGSGRGPEPCCPAAHAAACGLPVTLSLCVYVCRCIEDLVVALPVKKKESVGNEELVRGLLVVDSQSVVAGWLAVCLFFYVFNGCSWDAGGQGVTNCGWWPVLFVGVSPRCVLYKCCAGVLFRLVSGVWLPSSSTKNLTHDLTRRMTCGLTLVLSSDMSRDFCTLVSNDPWIATASSVA